ncbi:MAG TPA: hypothetical protein VF033_03880 [Steroidobacteraceae bacterium]
MGTFLVFQETGTRLECERWRGSGRGFTLVVRDPQRLESLASFPTLMAANPQRECPWFDAIRIGSIEAYTLLTLGPRPTSTH